jgi:Family of unknown function (DUF6498)
MRSLLKIIRDPAFWALAGFNILLIIQYNNNVKEYTTVIWLYWCQSVLLGFFTFIDMVTLKKDNVSVENLKIDNHPATPGEALGCLPWFFLVHYGIFHLVYMIFLFVDFHFHDLDFTTMKWALLSLFISYLFFFIQNRIRYRHVKRNIGYMFFTPYLRIVPMHLTILLPKFFHLQPALTFLVLKMAMDILGHLITTPYYWKHSTEPEPKPEYIQ